MTRTRDSSRHLRWLVGVDAGGSMTTALVADPSGQVVAQVSGPPGAVAPAGAAEAGRVIADTVREALRSANAPRAAAVVIGASGAGREPERSELERAIQDAGLAERVRVTTDIEIALAAAFGPAPGILVLAGTGSGACARLPSGEIRRTGGHGWQFGDEGSGYALAGAALAAVAQAADGRGPATALTTALAHAAGVAPDAVLAWARGAPRSAVAGLARAVQQTATEGDSVACQLIEDAARDLLAHVRALIGAFPSDQPVTVALAGGLLREGEPLSETLARHLGVGLPLTRLARGRVEPARGALHLAAKLL